MHPRPANDLDRDVLVEQLSRLDSDDPGEAVIAQPPSTVWGLKAELDTLTGQLRQPAGPDPFADESGLRRAQQLVLAIGVEPESKFRVERPELGRIGPYELLEKLGEGGMGAVYKALHSSLEKIVALKVLPRDRINPQAISRFKREMKAVGKLDHPNIVRATDAGEADGEHFLVMEYVDGVDLSELLRRVGPLAAADACELVRQAAVGLQHAHQRGLVHRDIKPSNLMLAWSDEHAPAVKILDLGLALLSEPQAPVNGDLTTTGQMMGSLEYMSPEQSLDTHQVDIRADIYSLGATLFKLLCGKAPFSGERFNTPGKLLVALATGTLPSLGEQRDDLPTGLIAIVDRMLARAPAERPATPAEVAQALVPFASGADLTRLANTARHQKTPSDPFPVAEVVRLRTHRTLTSSATAAALEPEAPARDFSRSPSLARQASMGTPVPAANRRRVAVLAVIGLFAVLGGAILFGGQIIRIATNKGQIVIETDGAGIEVVIKDNQGKVLDTQTKREITFQAGEYHIEVTVKDSGGEQRFATDHFILTRNGKKIVDARWEVAQAKPATAPVLRATDPASSDPDRRAAEYVLSIGGTIGFMENGKERKIAAVADLPRGAFELTLLSLNWNTKVSDAGLANCKGCKNLTVLDLDGTQVSDAGLSNFKDCKKLTHLGLHGTKVSDEGLALFKGCTDLTHFDVGGCASVSDAGLANFKDCKNLTSLDPTCAELSDAGLAYFKDCKNLTTLRVGGPQVTDAGLAYFKDYKDLTTLALGGPQIGDSGLAQFKDCKNIVGLHLNCAKMTEAGLLYFKDCKIGGLYLAGSQANDAWLAHFKDWKTTLGQLLLGDTQVSDAGLAHLKDCDIYVLQLVGTQVSDAGLVHLQGFKHLGGLDLTRTRVSDAGLEHLASIQSLGALELRGTKVTAAGVAKLQAALPNCKIESDFASPADPDRRAAECVLSIGGKISIKENGQERPIGAVGDLPRGAFELTVVTLDDNPKVSDAGLADLASLPSLAGLILDNTRISLHGHEQLKAALPKVQITWSETNRSVAESVLALGGTVEIGTPGQAESRPVKAAADLPGDYFQVRRVSLASVAQPLGELPTSLSWLRFPEFDRLESLDLLGSTALDYGFLVPIHGLRELTLANAGLTDDGLTKLPKLPALKRLVLDGNEIRGQGLTSLKEQPELIDLSLGCPTLTDLLAKNLAELKQIKRLSLAGSGLSDAGIKHLAPVHGVRLEMIDEDVRIEKDRGSRGNVSKGHGHSCGSSSGLVAMKSATSVLPVHCISPAVCRARLTTGSTRSVTCSRSLSGSGWAGLSTPFS